MCFLTTIKHFGVVKATSVTTVRKILTILLSFVLFPKPWHWMHLMGLFVFVLATAVYVQYERTKPSIRRESTQR